MIKRVIIFVVVIGILAFVVNNIFFVKIEKATSQSGRDSTLVSQNDEELYRGKFSGMDGIHNTAGDAVVVNTPKGPVLRLENFSVTPGPDLFVYLSKNGDITKSKDLGDQYVSLGSLVKISGDQEYVLPENFRDYKSVVIWCRAFSVLFGAAPIK